MAQYPAAVPNFPTHQDGVSPADTNPAAVLSAAEVNSIQAELTAIATELGPDASGAAATVAARLTAIESTALSGSRIWIPPQALSITVGTPANNATGIGSRYFSWQLSATVSQQLTCSFAAPVGWSALNVDAYWSVYAAASGDVTMQATSAYMGAAGTNLGDGALDSAGPVITQTAPAAANSLAITRVLNGVPVGVSPGHIRFLRRAVDATDTYTSEMCLMGLMLGKA